MQEFVCRAPLSVCHSHHAKLWQVDEVPSHNFDDMVSLRVAPVQKQKLCKLVALEPSGILRRYGTCQFGGDRDSWQLKLLPAERALPNQLEAISTRKAATR